MKSSKPKKPDEDTCFGVPLREIIGEDTPPDERFQCEKPDEDTCFGTSLRKILGEDTQLDER